MKSAAWALLLVVACAHAPATEQAASVTDVPPDRHASAPAYRHYLDALLAKNADDLPAAAVELRQALLYDPQSPHLHTVLAEVLLAQGRVAAAEEELHAALALEPRHAPALVLLGRIDEAREKPDDARGHLRAAIAADPASADAYRELVRLELSAGNMEGACDAAERISQLSREAQERAGREADTEDGRGGTLVDAERLREEAASAWLAVARSQAQRREHAAAEEAFAKARAALPSDPEVLSAQAAWLETRRRNGEARDLYLRLLAQRPEAPEVLASLARLALEDGDLDTARAHAQKLMALAAAFDASSVGAADDDRRELAVALLRVAVPLLGARRSADAQAALEGALRLYPNHPELSFHRALALVQRGRPREGAAAFEAVEKRLADRARPAAAPLLGADPEALALDAAVQAALARGRAGEASESLRRVRALFAAHPADEGVALALLDVLDRAGRTADAVQLLNEAARAHPQSDGLLYALGNAQDRAGRRKEALSTMRRALALQPEHSGALNFVGYTMAESGAPADLDEAEALLSRAVELRPDDGAIADSWGYCLLRRGRVDEALLELRRADKLAPGDPVILSHLGDALLAAGQKDKALAAFRTALSRLLPPSRKSPRPGTHALIDPPDRIADPSDGRVREEIERKLKALAP